MWCPTSEGVESPPGIPLRSCIAARNFFRATRPILRLAMVGPVRRKGCPELASLSRSWRSS